jgi:hypothetical protein
MRIRSFLSLIAVASLLSTAWAQTDPAASLNLKDRPAPTKADWKADIHKALDGSITNVKVEGASIRAALKLFAGSTGIKVTVDTALRSKAKIHYNLTKKREARDVLGDLLNLAGGLRFALLDGGIYVGTPGGVAAKLTTGSLPVKNGGRESEAMSQREAATVETATSYFRDFHDIGITGAGSTTTQQWEREYHDPRTGLTHFPGPPAVIEDPDVGARRFWFTTRKHYIRPDYRGLVPDSLSDNVRIHETLRTESGLDDLLKLIRDNPELNAGELLKKFEGGKK